MSNPRVSIIIPVYNAASTLARTLQSVVDQTYASRELIIIDGLSTDGSADILKTFSRDIQVLISERDTGVYQAINRGIDRATGEWILILGADDYLAERDVLQKCLTTQTGSDLILGNVLHEGASNKLVPEVYHNKMTTALYWRNTMHQQGVLYQRRVFENFRFDETCKVLADYDLHLKLLEDHASYHKVEVTIAKCSAGGLSKRFKAGLYREELKIKRTRLSPFIYLINIPWVWLKFLLKQMG